MQTEVKMRYVVKCKTPTGKMFVSGLKKNGVALTGILAHALAYENSEDAAELCGTVLCFCFAEVIEIPISIDKHLAAVKEKSKQREKNGHRNRHD